MTYYVDTNIVIRYLTRDDLEKAKQVRQRLIEARKGTLRLIITSFTAIEILFVLRNYYNIKKYEAIDKLQTFLSPDFIHVERKEVVLEALLLYKTLNIDFVDLLNWTIAKDDKAKILSFDKDFDKLTPKLRVEP